MDDGMDGTRRASFAFRTLGIIKEPSKSSMIFTNNYKYLKTYQQFDVVVNALFSPGFQYRSVNFARQDFNAKQGAWRPNEHIDKRSLLILFKNRTITRLQVRPFTPGEHGWLRTWAF